MTAKKNSKLTEEEALAGLPRLSAPKFSIQKISYKEKGELAHVGYHVMGPKGFEAKKIMADSISKKDLSALPKKVVDYLAEKEVKVSIKK